MAKNDFVKFQKIFFPPPKGFSVLSVFRQGLYRELSAGLSS